MFKKVKAIVLATLTYFALNSLPASASFSYLGNELLSDHKDHPDFYFGFVFANYMVLTSQGWAGQCLKMEQGVSGDQVIDIVKIYLENNPASRNKTASFLVKEALFEAFGFYEAKGSNWCY